MAADIRITSDNKFHCKEFKVGDVQGLSMSKDGTVVAGEINEVDNSHTKFTKTGLVTDELIESNLVRVE